MKPRIKWWGNGDVHMGCFNAYRLCYPNDIATFRTDFIHKPKPYEPLRFMINLKSPPIDCRIINPNLLSSTFKAP